MFLTKLVISDLRPDEWLVEAPLVWFCREFGRIEVPAGFVTDLASIPRFLRSVFNVNGKSRKAAVLHDFLYCANRLTRSECDALFYAALVDQGMNAAFARTYWLGVRAGGWRYFGKRKFGINKDDFINNQTFFNAKQVIEDDFDECA